MVNIPALRLRKPCTFALAIACASAIPKIASADTYYYVNWTAADVSKGTASGTITLPDNSVVNVTFAAINQDATPGNLYGAQINGNGTNYWDPASTWISAQVQNGPPDPDILQLAGGQNETYRVTLSAPIVDPIMAIVSLGAAGAPATYNFDSPFIIESQGPDNWGGSSSALTMLPNNVLQGEEGSGTIQFQGTYSTFSWTVPTPETWHGFTFGIRTTLALDPDAGAPDAGASDAATDAASDAATDAMADAASDAAADSGLADGGVDASTPDAGASDGAVADAAPNGNGGSDSGGYDATAPDGGSDNGQQQPGTTTTCSCRTVGLDAGSSGIPFAGFGALAAIAILWSRRKPR